MHRADDDDNVGPRGPQGRVKAWLKLSGNLASTKLKSKCKSVVGRTTAAFPEASEGASATWPAEAFEEASESAA